MKHKLGRLAFYTVHSIVFASMYKTYHKPTVKYREWHRNKVTDIRITNGVTMIRGFGWVAEAEYFLNFVIKLEKNDKNITKRQKVGR